MKKELSSIERVTWRGLPKRAWFKRDTYTYRSKLNNELTQSLPAKWHAGVDIIQTRTPHPGYPDNPMLDRVEMHVRAACGYVYTFDFILAATRYGRATYRDAIKNDAIRCKKCDAELAKAPEKRSQNNWAVPPTSFKTEATGEEELWWPSDKERE